jgi:hypothetical protein
VIRRAYLTTKYYSKIFGLIIIFGGLLGLGCAIKETNMPSTPAVLQNEMRETIS